MAPHEVFKAFYIRVILRVQFSAILSLSIFCGSRAAIADGLALSLDGINDYARSNTSIFPDTSDLSSFTVESWIYPTRRSIQWIAADDSFDLKLYYQSGASNGGLGIQFVLFGPGSNQAKVEYRDVQLDQWNHVAGMYDATSGEARIAINGILSSSPLEYSGTSFLSDPDYDFVVGQSGFGNGYFQGTIDELRVSNAVKYVSEFTPANTLEVDGDTKALYHFDESEGSTSYGDETENAFALDGFNGAHTIPRLDPTILIGDYSDNMVVDAADYTVWRDNFGSTTMLPNDETPGVVGDDDYVAWKAHFGETDPGIGSGNSAAVPEPDTAWLIFAAAIAHIGIRGIRRGSSAPPTPLLVSGR